MSNSDIVKTSLEAFEIAQNTNYEISANGQESDWIPDWLEAIAKPVWDAIVNFGGFIFGLVGSALEFTLSKAWGIVVQSSVFVWNFNWDQTDEQLDQQVANLQILLSSQLGATTGSLLGYLVCGAIPGAAMLKFNKALAIKILKDVGEEALEEFASNLAVLCQTALNGLFQMTLINSFKAVRRFLKDFFNNPNSPQSRFMSGIFGDRFNDFIAGWGDGKDNYSFSNLTEEAIERIPNANLRAFVEEMLEEFADSCIEAGYIVAGGLDEWVAQKKLEKQALLGEQKIVEIIPNRDAPDEKLILAGNEALLKNTLVQTINNHNMIENRNIGQFMGSQVQTFLKKDPLELGIKIVWATKQKPPFGQDCKFVDCTIEGIDRSKLEWELIKTLAGGENGFNWGRFRATANLSNGGQFVIHGNTKEEAEDMARRLIQLSEFEILTLSVTEHLREGLRRVGQPLEIDDRRVYPVYMTITNRQKIINEARRGQGTLNGTYFKRSHQINLWTSNPPRNYDDIITELLRDGTGTA